MRAGVMGVVFAAGWTPCIGPILSGIIALATMSATAWSGVSLMVAYCLGLGLPIVAVASVRAVTSASTGSGVITSGSRWRAEACWWSSVFS